jgi:hypothetical protein
LVIEQSDKIDIARILMKRIDGVVAQARVSTLGLANAVLERWAAEAPEKGEGHCQIQIVFEDGFQYRSQIGLKRSQKRISLAKHLRQQLLGKAPPQTGRRRTDDSHSVAIFPSPAPSLTVEAMLARYDI